MIITSELIRAARALLRWEQKDLAQASGVSLPSIKRLETQPGPLAAQDRTTGALKAAIEAAGVEFTNGGQPGVRMRLLPYLLRPVDPSDSAWASSIHKSGLWVLATSERDAREKAKLATIILTALTPGKMSIGSPWAFPDKVTCEQKPCPYPLKIGEPLNENGRSIE